MPSYVFKQLLDTYDTLTPDHILENVQKKLSREAENSS